MGAIPVANFGSSSLGVTCTKEFTLDCPKSRTVDLFCSSQRAYYLALPRRLDQRSDRRLLLLELLDVFAGRCPCPCGTVGLRFLVFRKGHLKFQ